MTNRKMSFGRYDYAAFTAFISYAAGSVVVPVALVALAEELGFSLKTGGLSAGGALQVGRSIPMVIAMLVCGFASARWGKCKTLGVSILLMGTGIGLCAMAPAYGILFIGLMIAGMGEGVVEGLATPFVQDLHSDQPGRYLNFTHSFWSVGVLITVIISGLLLSLGVSWRLIIGAVSITSLIPALLLLLPARKKFPEHKEPIHWTIVHNHVIEIIKVPRFWLFFAAMFVAGGGEFCLTFWTASYIQLNFSAAAWAGGLGTASFSAGMIVGRFGWGYLLHQHHLKQLIFYSALAGTAITLLFPVITSFWFFFILLFLSGIASAPFWPSVQSYCSDCIPKADTTMLFILLSCAGVPGCGFFTWLMGLIGNHAGLSVAFYIVPACYIILAAIIGFAWRHRLTPPPVGG
ncbi:MAG: MFS transporter [Phycisphaerales bacterium]